MGRPPMAHDDRLTSSTGLCRWIPTPSQLGSRRTELRFTVRRPASAEVSPCCHRPSGGDIACGVHVGIARPRTTRDAPENRLALAVFRRDMPAVRAPLRRERCRDAFQAPRGLVLQPGDQHSPSLAADLTVEAPLLRDVIARALSGTARGAGHRTHVQVLHADGVEPARHLGAGLFHPVTAAICLTGPQPGNGQLRARPPTRSAARTGQTPLQPPQPLSFPATKSRDTQQLPGGQGHRDRHAAIDSHDAAITGASNRFRDDGKRDMPAPRPIQSDSIRLHGAGDGAGPAEPHPTHLGDPYLPVAAAEPLDVARLHSDLPKSFMRAGFTPGRATVGAVKEIAHRVGEVPQRLLLHGLRSGGQPVVCGARRGQLRTLLAVSGCVAARLPMPLLLHGQIPHKPGMATVLSQRACLLNAGQQPKPRHHHNINTTTATR